ncbi:MAG: FkbM family methyltransferase [Cyanobacteria bacterium RI_101]|nr:FkbM family methyltransferase [Cyanobacteria bacterium RI_101]
MQNLKKLAKGNPLLSRAKAVKDLVLDKLDRLLAYAETFDGAQAETRRLLEENQAQVQSLVAQNQELLALLNQSLESQAFSLKSLVDITQGTRRLIETQELLRADYQRIWEGLQGAQGQHQDHHVAIRQTLGEFNEKFDAHSQTLAQGLERLLGELNQSYESLSRQLLSLQNDASVLDTKLAQVSTEMANTGHLQPVILPQASDAEGFQHVELDLMSYLYSFLPYPKAIDIGANRGDVSLRLLETGYEVYAFEPFPPVIERLGNRLGENPQFHLFPVAVGAENETKELYIAADQTAEGVYEDSTFYSSLTPHSLAEGLVFTEKIPVAVKTLASLHDAQALPPDIGLVKIDTEGFDLEVIRGMGDYRYPVVITEFWDEKFPFGQSGAYNHIQDLVPAMKDRGYLWYIVLYRVWGSHEVSFYANLPRSVENAWGNIFFFQDYGVFSQGLRWCSSLVSPTYFS